MRREKHLAAICTLMVLISLTAMTTALPPIKLGSTQGYATIYVNPKTNNFTTPPTTVGSKFTVQARISNYSRVAAWQVKLVYDARLINTSSTGASYASDFIFPTGSYAQTPASVAQFNSTHWYAMMTAATYGGVEYNGTNAGLMRINFTILKVPNPGQKLSCTLWLEPAGTWTVTTNVEENDDTRTDGYYQIKSTLQDTQAPSITILHPENTTYHSNSIPLIFHVNETTSWVGYSLDHHGNITINDNTTLVGLSEGAHTIRVYANDTAGNMGASSTRYFTVQTKYQITFAQTGVNTGFTGTIVTIDEANYKVSDLPISFTWSIGSNHSFAFQSPLIMDLNKKHIWTNTSGLSNLRNGTITITTFGSIIGNYRAQYYLNVSSPYGITSGQGWYDSGDTAYARLDIGLVNHGNKTRRVFTNWSDGATGTNYASSEPITMNGPKTAVAEWKTQYLLRVLTDPAGLSPQPAREPMGDPGPPALSGWWYDASINVSLTAQSVAGYSFSHWDVDATSRGARVNPININIDAPHTATAHYIPRDIAALSVTPSKTVVGAGYSLTIKVIVENHGGITETFNVTIYANTAAVTFQEVTLQNGGSATVFVIWDTSGFAKGNYTISAVVGTIPAEINTGNNNATDGWILVTIPGDANGDYRCNGKDNALVSKAYDTRPGDTRWIANADINSDGKVDGKDIAIIAKYYDTHYP